MLSGRTARTGARVYRRVLAAPPPWVPRPTRGWSRAWRGVTEPARTPLLGSPPTMPPLAAIERFFERLFERPSARLFRVRLQPVQLQRRIERAMEAERLATADRTLVPEPLRRPPPSRPTSRGSANDRLARIGAGRWRPACSPGRAGTRSSIGRASTSSPTDASSAPTSGSSPDSPTRSPAASGTTSRPTVDDAQAMTGTADRPAGRAMVTPASGTTDTMVFTVPRPSAPAARLRVITPDGDESSASSTGPA